MKKNNNDNLNEFLAKKTNGGAASGKQTPKPAADNVRKITLSDGKVVQLDELAIIDKKDGNKNGYILKTGKGFKQHFKRKPEAPKQLPSNYVCPEWIKKFTNYSDGLTEKQKEYKKRVVDSKTLRATSPNKYISKNPQGLHDYIFWTELYACKNGFLYYTLPLLLSITFLIINTLRFNFFVNAILSLVVLLDYIMLRRTIKSRSMRPALKTLLVILIILANVAVGIGVTYVPYIIERIRLEFAIQILAIIFGIYHFGKFYVDFAKMYSHDCNLDFGNTVKIKAGKPRSGKTSSGVQDVLILAKQKWKELQYDYWLWVSREKEIIKRGNPDELMQLYEIKKSYKFYTEKKCIPCLWSNIGIFDKKGRASHKVTLEHIKGLDPLPVYSVVFLDEIGAMLKAEDGLNRSGFENPRDISDMFRLGGHFLKWIVIGCEQDFNHIFIDCRRVVGVNELIEGQEWICRPTLLWNLFKFLKFLKSDSLDTKVKKNPKFANFMYRFEKFVRSIGFRQIRYSHVSNTQTKAKVSGASDESTMMTMGHVRTRICPANLAADYDDRAYKQKYPSYFDKEIKGALHKHKFIEAVDENTAAFVNTTAALSEKRNAQIEEIKKLYR